MWKRQFTGFCCVKMLRVVVNIKRAHFHFSLFHCGDALEDSGNKRIQTICRQFKGQIMKRSWPISFQGFLLFPHQLPRLGKAYKTYTFPLLWIHKYSETDISHIYSRSNTPIWAFLVICRQSMPFRGDYLPVSASQRLTFFPLSLYSFFKQSRGSGVQKSCHGNTKPAWMTMGETDVVALGALQNI